jgi:hypothetical protein
MAKEAVAQQRQNHFILLILTDGYPRLPSLNYHDDQRTNSLDEGLYVCRSIT